MKKSLFGLALALAGVMGFQPVATQAGGILACSEATPDCASRMDSPPGGGILACSEATPDLSQDSLLISGNFKNCKNPSAWLGQANGSYTKLVATLIDNKTVRATLIDTAVVVGSMQNVVVKCGWSARCAIDVAFVEEGPPAPVPTTGQTPTVPLDPAPSGSDGALQKGVAWPNPRFTINVNADKDTGADGGTANDGICNGTEECNGTVTDNLTGLIWLRNANCFGTPNWDTALTDANTLNSGECGLTDGSVEGDWRLPNINELHSLVDIGYSDRALPNTEGTGQWSEGNPFSGVKSYHYWSSSARADKIDYAWRLSLNSGGVYYGPKSSTHYVWPVRGG